MSERETKGLPEGWTSAKVGDILQIRNGFAFRSSDYRSTGVPLIRQSDIGENVISVNSAKRVAPEFLQTLSTFLVRKGDLLIGMSGSLGKIGKYYEDEPALQNQRTGLLLLEDECETNFAKLVMQFVERQIIAGGKGIAVQNVSASQIEDCAFPLPPFREQHRISALTDELYSDLDAGVTALERVRAKLKHYRAAVLKSAVDGTLTAEWRGQHPVIEPASELLKRILSERRSLWEVAQLQKFKDAGKSPPKDWKEKYQEPAAAENGKRPKLPDGWCWASVEQLSILRSGQTPAGMPVCSEPEGTIQWFRVADMNVPGNEKWMAEGGVRLRRETVTALGLRLISAGSIIFPKRGGAIATNKKRLLRIDSACDLNLMAVSPLAVIAPYLWLFFLKLDLARLSDGSNVPQINNPDIAPLAVSLPSSTEQAAIVELVEDQLSVIDHLETDLDTKLKSAHALRQSILRDAFEGKLVPQDPNDEPASELLKRIALERERRAREILATKKAKTNPKTARRKAVKS